jgi:hypothetical protein
VRPVETLTSLNPLRLDPSPDYDEVTPLAPIRPVGAGSAQAQTARTPTYAPVPPPAGNQGQTVEVAVVNPLISALDRLRATRQLRPIDDEFLALQRGMRFYRRLRSRTPTDEEVERGEGALSPG